MKSPKPSKTVQPFCILLIPFILFVSLTIYAGMPKNNNRINERISEFGASARNRMASYFASASIHYPPKKIILLAIKKERAMEFWAADSGKAPKFVRAYKILGASGKLGPKLMEGDRQVPEGFYKVVLLNPDSKFHVSLRLDYPNAFDKKMGLADGRESLGGDIMIHGSDCSIGCLAMGDTVAEELFTLAADSGVESMEVVISPLDFRKAYDPKELPVSPSWVPPLHDRIKGRMDTF